VIQREMLFVRPAPSVAQAERLGTSQKQACLPLSDLIVRGESLLWVTSRHHSNGGIGLFSGPLPTPDCSDRDAALKPPPQGRLLKALRERTFGGSVMRIILALALLGASLLLSGCFHHNQAVYAEPLPPPAHPPLK
jgi:hypothetical protein